MDWGLRGEGPLVLIDTLLDTTSRHGRDPAVADPFRRLTYRQLATTSAALCRAITKSTDCPRVGIMLPASTAFPVTLFGALWANRTAVPLNFLLAPDELRRIVEDAGIDVIFTVRFFDKLVAELPARGIALERLGLKRRVIWSSLTSYPQVPKVDPNETAVLLYTSGTSAEPKGVELSYNNLMSNCKASIEAARLDRGIRLFNILPPFHVFGLTANVLMPVVLGASVFAMPRFRPAAAVKAIHDERITALLGIPSMYNAMARLKNAPADAMQSVRIAISGGEPLPHAVGDLFQERFGVTIDQGYGLTETSPVLSLCSPTLRKPGSVGRPIPGTTCRIIDDDGADLPPDTDGEIIAKGPGLMRGYFNRAMDTALVIDDKGWLHTGDIGRLDADGFLYITGRKKEMIIVGGENVFPGEIEAVLVEHPLVAEAAVIGMPDDSRGEAPIAFVIPTEAGAGSADLEQQIRNFARTRLAGYKVPKHVHIAEDLPRGPTGKVLKRRLHDILATTNTPDG